MLEKILNIEISIQYLKQKPTQILAISIAYVIANIAYIMLNYEVKKYIINLISNINIVVLILPLLLMILINGIIIQKETIFYKKYKTKFIIKELLILFLFVNIQFLIIGLLYYLYKITYLFNSKNITFEYNIISIMHISFYIVIAMIIYIFFYFVLEFFYKKNYISK